MFILTTLVVDVLQAKNAPRFKKQLLRNGSKFRSPRVHNITNTMELLMYVWIGLFPAEKIMNGNVAI